jgi:hypothetical protein
MAKGSRLGITHLYVITEKKSMNIFFSKTTGPLKIFTLQLFDKVNKPACS